MEIGAKFKNITSYNLEMIKSLEDKLFFVEKFPKNENYTFVDFGCADGTYASITKNGVISVENTKITCSEDVKTAFEKAVTNISNYDTPTA